MKTETYKKNDGTEGTKNLLEAGDKVVSKFKETKKNEGGKYPSYSLGVEGEKPEDTVYIQITEGQNKNLVGKDLTGKTLEAYEYENQYGKYVGVKVL